MDNYKSFTDRIVTTNPTVCGYRTKSFCLGHVILLKACDSKFINGEYNGFLSIHNILNAYLHNDKDLMTEFAIAILICSTTYDDFKEEFAAGKIMDAVKELKESMKDYNLFLEIHAFSHYISKGQDTPTYEIKENDNSITDNPITPEESIIATLMTNCNYTRNECINLPFVETISAYLVYAHSMGTIEIVSKEYLELKNKMKGLT